MTADFEILLTEQVASVISFAVDDKQEEHSILKHFLPVEAGIKVNLSEILRGLKKG